MSNELSLVHCIKPDEMEEFISIQKGNKTDFFVFTF